MYYFEMLPFKPSFTYKKIEFSNSELVVLRHWRYFNFVYPDTKITGNFKIFPTRVACISSISTNQDFIMSYVLPNVQLMMRRVSRGLRKKILCFFSIRLQLLLDLIRISWTLTINLYSTYHHYNISKPTPLLKCQSLFPSYYPTHFGNGVHFLSLLFIRIGFN